MHPLHLISIFVVAAEAVNLHQEKLTLTRSTGKSGVIECMATDFSTNNIIWYLQKDGEPLTRILFMNKGGGKATRDPGFEHYQAEKGDGSLYTLRIPSISEDNVATYYCASLDSGSGTQEILQFGSGSKLFISDDQVQKPNVTVYPASKHEPNGTTILLCLARGMFPDLVQISWKMVDRSGQNVDVPPGEKIQLEQREKGQTTSMIIIDKGKAEVNNYVCSVMHESGVIENPAKEQSVKVPQWVKVPQLRPGRNETHSDGSFQSMFSLNLASLVYTVMIVKSLVYCCGITLLLQRRNMGSGPPIQRTS